MSGIAIILGLVIVAVAAVVVVRSQGAHSVNGSEDLPEARDSEPVGKSPQESSYTQSKETKPAVTDIYADEPAHDLNEGLSQSGALTIGAEVKRCIDAEKWDEAIKWLLHASDALPDRTDFKVTLAELYAKTDDRDNFTTLFEKLYVDIDDTSDDMTRLLQVARDYVPEHAIFQT